MKKLQYLALVLLFLSFFSCTYDNPGVFINCELVGPEVMLTTKTGTQCGLAEGTAQVSTIGGGEELSYFVDGEINAGGDMFTGLTAGTHDIEVIDENGCSDVITIVIENIDGINISEVSGTDTSCGGSNGTITVEVEGGEPPFQYKIDEQDFQAENTFVGLSQGQHEVQIIDEMGCLIIQSVDVSSGVTFTKSIAPIISSSCAITNCHAGDQSPDFRVLQNIVDRSERIRARTQNRTMPRVGTLTQEQIDLIACWVDDGAIIN